MLYVPRCFFFAQLVAAQQPSFAKRIAALAPSLTELVYAAGAGDKLVAVSAFSDFPADAAKYPQVADYSGINLEALLARKPDLVLVWSGGTREADVVRLRMSGIRVESIGVIQLSDVPKALRQIGRLANTGEAAEAAAKQFEARLDKLNREYQTAKPITAFFEISHKPLMSIGGQHFISEVLRTCGASNVFGGVDLLAFEPSREILLVKNPQVIVYATSSNSREKAKRNNDAYAGLRAQRLEHFVTIESDHILRPGPRLIDAAEEACRAIDKIRRQLRH